ncbi:FAD-binding oxidoreductase [Actinomadura sp. KC06]|uniref:NAD(P)/FAD-dependent oxidoreductase n=1 Tax=Actinomadura sp. KC06 TaxID=2530369 RepID=UPI001043D74A|nr:FAD-binding oxidoreductase [Actinomadura sp. KC06]TDD32958.1 FAD-binding oxidoreductase [Actinomadura sp. KC06]
MAETARSALDEPLRGWTNQRIVIVGAGVTGLLAAVRAVLLGHHVVVLERGPIPNPGASSSDHHRAVRALDPGDPSATRRAADAHRRWVELEALLCGPPPGAGFYRRIGVVTAWPEGEIPSVAAAARDAGLRVELVGPREMWPIGFPDGTSGVLELDAGVLLADRVLAAAAGWLDRHPAAELRPGHDVVAVDADAARVELADGTVEHGDLVLVAAGPWSSRLVDVPVVVHRQTMVYLTPPAELAGRWERMPSAGRIGADGRGWLLPPGAGAHLKISTDAARREVGSAGEDGDGDEADERAWAEKILAAGILADAGAYAVAAVKRCHYAVDAGTGAGRLARVGTSVWARAASGGDGFRTAPLVADQIAGALLGVAA